MKKKYIKPEISSFATFAECQIIGASKEAEIGGGENGFSKRQVSYDDDDSSVGFGSDWDF